MNNTNKSETTNKSNMPIEHYLESLTVYGNDPVEKSGESKESILESVDKGYKPDDSENVLIKIEPAQWEPLIKILDILSKDSNDSIIIQDSVIIHSYNGAILRVKLDSIFSNEDRVNLHIINPKKWISKFKIFTNTNVYIIKDQQKNIFTVTDGEIRLYLPVQLESSLAALKIPEMDISSSITTTNIEKNIRDKINSLGKGAEFLEYLIQNENIKGINIPDVALYVFPEYINEKDIRNLNEESADISLRTSAFLPITSDEYTLYIGQKPDTSYFSYMTCKMGSIDIEIYESLDDSSGSSLFI